MKKVLSEPPEIQKQIEAEKRQILNETFRKAPFSEIIKCTQPKHDNLQNILNDIFAAIPPTTTPVTDGYNKNNYSADKPERVPIYEEYFPELFVY